MLARCILRHFIRKRNCLLSVASENESAHRIGDVQFMRQTVHRVEHDMGDECVCCDLQLFKLAQVVQVACLSLSKTDLRC